MAGTLALVQQAFPYFTSQQLVQDVLTTATPLGDPAIYGQGLLNVGAAVGGPGPLDMNWTINLGGLSSVWSNNISGGLTVTGGGLLALTGSDTYTGGTSVVGAALSLSQGASVAGDVTVGAAGTLLGQGGIGGNLFNTAGGLVQPGGGTIGTLTVVGNYRQDAASGLGIEVSSATASKLLVGGAAQLGGTLTVVYDPGT